LVGPRNVIHHFTYLPTSFSDGSDVIKMSRINFKLMN
jgi:hypothetical protein